jgi:hypothetical protein
VGTLFAKGKQEEAAVMEQVVWLFILALPVASVSWTLAHEEVLRELREWLALRSQTCCHWWQRKFCYMWTCEYCLSHSIAAVFVALTDYQLLQPGWRGYLVAWLALVAVANVYLSAYGRLRVEIHKDLSEIKQLEAGRPPAEERAA